MGNCVCRRLFGADQTETVKVVTSDGNIKEFPAPITASFIAEDFPAHDIYRSDDLSAQPLRHNEELDPHELYHLLPLNPCRTPFKSPSLYCQNSGIATPYRMSLKERHRCSKKGNGVWKVNMVIRAEEVLEIFSQGDKTKELIDCARTVAKCGSNGGSSEAGSEHSSTVRSMSRRNSKKHNQ